MVQGLNAWQVPLVYVVEDQLGLPFVSIGKCYNPTFLEENVVARVETFMPTSLLPRNLMG